MHHFKSIPPSSGQYYYLFYFNGDYANPVCIITIDKQLPYSMGKKISLFSDRDRHSSNNYSLFMIFLSLTWLIYPPEKDY